MNHTPEPLLEVLIESLEQYANDGVKDPWLLNDGTTVDPLDILHELREYRNGCAGLNPGTYRACVEALRQLIKFAHLYQTASDDERKRPSFGASLHDSLRQAITEAADALVLTERGQP